MHVNKMHVACQGRASEAKKYLVSAWLARPLLILILAAHELKVALEEGTVHCSLVRRLVDLGEVGLAGRVALEAASLFGPWPPRTPT